MIQVLRIMFIVTLGFTLSACLSSGRGNSNLAQDLANRPHSNALAFAANKQFGRSLSRTERQELTKAEFQALTYGQNGEAVKWSGGSSETSGTIRVFQLFKVGSSSCRRFQHQLLNEGRRESVAGTACIREQGSWQLVE